MPFQLVESRGSGRAWARLGERLAVGRARLVARSTDAQLGRLERGPVRWLVIRSLPVVLPLLFSRKAARGLGGPPLSGVVELEIRRPDGRPPDVVHVVIGDGRCRVRHGRAARPGATISIGLVDMARMGSGSVDPAAFLAKGIAAGRISLSGDVFLFLAFPNLFRMANRKLI